MNTRQLCEMLAQTIEEVKSNSIEIQKAQTLLGLANAMTRARRLQLDYNRIKCNNTPRVDGLDDQNMVQKFNVA